MKSVIFSLVVCYCASFASADREVIKKFKDHVQSIGMQCIEETHAPEEAVAEILAHQTPTKHETKCLIFCIHKHLNMMNEDGTINKEGSVENLEKLKGDEKVYNVLKETLEVCLKTEIDADPCVTSANYAMCGFREATARGLTEEDM